MNLLSALAAILFFLILSSLPGHGVVLYQSDDFSSGVEGWDGGQTGLPQQVLSGGPGGAGDSYLQVSTTGFHLGTKNGAQWSGNILGEGISQIRFDANPMGPDDLDLRILIFGPGGAWATNTITPLSTGTGWQTLSFGIAPDDLVYVPLSSFYSGPLTPGTGVATDTLSNVSLMLIRNDTASPTEIGAHPPHITTVLGLDNITAVPEPQTATFAALALVSLLWRRRTTLGC